MVQDMPARSRSNPLALAVLACLFEKPMHPYEMAQTMRTRAKHESVKLNYGSLYGVVEGLERRGLIQAVETTREGRRPQRTIYAITPEGEVELSEWMAEIVSLPTKEYLRFEAGLSFLGALPPDEAAALLRQRSLALEVEIDQMAAAIDGSRRRGLPRLFFVETEYTLALARCELDFVRALAGDIEAGRLPGLDLWRSWYEPDGPAAAGAVVTRPPTAALLTPAGDPAASPATTPDPSRDGDGDT
jgi:DNA-binding PadR family transcriptional regulator